MMETCAYCGQPYGAMMTIKTLMGEHKVCIRASCRDQHARDYMNYLRDRDLLPVQKKEDAPPIP